MRAIIYILLILSSSAFSQSQRLTLFEEFTQASCLPCEEMNPELNRILNSLPDKVVSIKYQTFFPGIDPMNAHNPIDVDIRYDNYNIFGVPFGKLDGGTAFSGLPDQFDSSHILNRNIVSSPFEIEVDFLLTPSSDTIVCTANVRCTQNTTGNFVAHMVVIERDIYFAESPGTNDETHFEGVMKKMLPSAYGTPIPQVWIAGDSLTLNYSWALSNVYDINQLACVVFIQDTINKEVYQAGYKPPNISEDVSIRSIKNLPLLQCSTSINPELTIRNNGFNNLTSLDIQLLQNGSQTQVYSWTGNLFPYHETVINFPAVTLADGGYVLTFKAVDPNGSIDIIPLNDTANSSIVISTGTTSLPYNETFDSTGIITGGIAVLDPVTDGINWSYSNSGNGTGSLILPVFDENEFGTTDYFFLPKFDLSGVSTPVNLTFDVAYAPYNASLAEDLLINVSIDCGITWQEVYNKSSNALATAPATTNFFVPIINQWRNETVSLDSFAGINEVLIQYELFGRRGNNIYIDNINVTGMATNIEVINSQNINVYPQPATDHLYIKTFEATLFSIAKIYNSSAQLVLSHQFTNENFNNSIDISGLKAGVYFLSLNSNTDLETFRFIILR
jgi:hypothetical protein